MDMAVIISSRLAVMGKGIYKLIHRKGMVLAW